MKKPYTFEVLCLDSKGNSVIKNELNLLYSLLANGELWSTPVLKSKSIIDSSLNISLNIKRMSEEEEKDINIKSTYLIKVKGEFETLEQFRIKLVMHLKKQGYDHTYILLDEISSEISCVIYPRINQVENLLRKYLMKFFITKLGPSWWNITADSEMKKKVISRKNNENYFSDYIDNKAFLIDFGELGKIVHSQSSGFISREDIVEKVLILEETPEAIINLKKELESNYTKFFKDTFKDKAFQQKWEQLEKIRHKVAHNNLFTRDDLERSEALSNELIEIINNANTKIDSINFSVDEKDFIKENITNNLDTYNVISEEDLLKKLEESEKWALRTRDNFVGLKHFVTNYLGLKGFDYSSSYDLINDLEKRGVVEIYPYHNEGHSYPITAIKRVIKPKESLPEIKN